jgi:hypothetical protein
LPTVAPAAPPISVGAGVRKQPAAIAGVFLEEGHKSLAIGAGGSWFSHINFLKAEIDGRCRSE